MSGTGTSCVYADRFGLTDAPFAPVADSRFLVATTSYLAAVDDVSAALARHDPIIVLTGEPGVGKTMLCQTLARWCRPRTLVAAVSKVPGSVEDFLRQALDGFGVLSGGETNGAVEAGCDELGVIMERFLSSLTSLQAQALIVVDDAEWIEAELLGEIQRLPQLRGGSGPQTLQLLLVGRPELENHADCRKVSCQHVRPLNAEEISNYVNTRLTVASSGSRDRLPVFDEGSLDAMARISAGIPAIVNLLCDHVLESAWRADTRTIDDAIVMEVARSLNLDFRNDVPVPIKRRDSRRLALAAMVLVAIGMGGWAMYNTNVLAWRRGDSAAPSNTMGGSAARAKGTDPDLADLLQRSALLSQKPDVRAVQQLRDEVVRRQNADESGTRRDELKAALDQVEKDLDQARRRQLMEDGRRLKAAEK